MRAARGLTALGAVVGGLAGTLWITPAAGGGAARAAATATVIYGGLTSQKEPVIIEVNPARTRVVKVLWEWRARCTLGAAAPAGTPLTTAWSDSAARFPIRRGSWSGAFTAGPFTDPATGVVQRFTYRLSGTLRAGARMSGTIRATYAERSPAGPIRDCRSGPITYNIRD